MSAILPFIFQRRLFLSLSLAFMAFAVIGTLSHEAGHYFMARHYGYDKARINYAYTFYGERQANDTLLAIWHRNTYALEHKQSFPEESRYLSLQQQVHHEYFIVTLSGPLQTMLTGTLGFLLILLFGKTYRSTEDLAPWQWLFVFLSFFWLRQVFNLIACIGMFILKGSWGHGDETRLCLYAAWPPLSAYIITGCLAAIVFCVVFFYYIPVKQRFSLLAAGIVGGIGGSLLWLKLLGPLIMP